MARTVTVALGQHYEEFIQANIAGGRYNNASEVVRAALRRLEEDEARIAAFCAAVDEGDASPDVLDFDEEAFIQVLKRILLLTGPLVQNIKQAYRPCSSVEWLFPCSMRSKWRHRAGKSALQSPRTPLALLDELHEG